MSRPNYQNSPFWEQRYKQNICEWYQWLATPNQLAPLISSSLPQPSRILELGCGSSNLADKLMSLHHQSVTCLDFSKEIIKNKGKHSKEGISYKFHDISQPLPFEDGSFDALVQKNVLDCLFCQEDFPVRVLRVMKQCYRVLREGGVMLSFSHGKPKTRRIFYRNRFSPFNLRVVPVDNLKASQGQVVLYVLTKGGDEYQEQGGGYQEQVGDEEQEGLLVDNVDKEVTERQDGDAKQMSNDGDGQVMEGGNLDAKQQRQVIVEEGGVEEEQYQFDEADES